MSNRMMWCYDFPAFKDSDFNIEMPESAYIVRVHGSKIWAIIDPQAPLKKRSFRIVRTGESFNHEQLYWLGMMYSIDFHVFEVVPVRTDNPEDNQIDMFPRAMRGRGAR